jgi:hypothetical protein
MKHPGGCLAPEHDVRWGAVIRCHVAIVLRDACQEGLHATGVMHLAKLPDDKATRGAFGIENDTVDL